MFFMPPRFFLLFHFQYRTSPPVWWCHGTFFLSGEDDPPVITGRFAHPISRPGIGFLVPPDFQIPPFQPSIQQTHERLGFWHYLTPLVLSDPPQFPFAAVLFVSLQSDQTTFLAFRQRDTSPWEVPCSPCILFSCHTTPPFGVAHPVSAIVPPVRFEQQPQTLSPFFPPPPPSPTSTPIFCFRGPLSRPTLKIFPKTAAPLDLAELN